MNDPKNYDANGVRLTDCCSSYSTWFETPGFGLDLCCRGCMNTVEQGEGDGNERRADAMNRTAKQPTTLQAQGLRTGHILCHSKGEQTAEVLTDAVTSIRFGKTYATASVRIIEPMLCRPAGTVTTFTWMAHCELFIEDATS